MFRLDATGADVSDKARFLDNLIPLRGKYVRSVARRVETPERP